MPVEGLLAYESGEWEINLARRELRLRGEPIRLGGRAFDIIEVLIQSAGQLVTKDDLMSRIWPDLTVGWNTLHVHVSAIRQALGADRWMLKTTTGRGYRLLGSWTVKRNEAAAPAVGLRQIHPTTEATIATNLPAAGTRIVGRSEAVRRVRDRVSAWRVVTLTGPGGIGKTALALEVARGVVSDFAHGGWLVELASLSDPSLVPNAIAGVLRLAVGPNNVTPEAVARAIRDKQLLLVLDNCEHLIAAIASLAETLMTLCPRITIVATSREPLSIQGEYVYRVPPLDVPTTEQIDVAGILGHSAVELFIAKAEEFGADVASNAKYPPMIASICRHLDGIPLAIEFAATRAATLGVERVGNGLQDRFALLTSGRRTAPRRHQTLRATLDWSYQLLSESERDVLHRLSIFAGPFSLDAARAVAAEGTSYAQIAESVAGLVGKSLVCRATEPGASEFRLLETIRAYAIDRLTGSGGYNHVARLHARYFLIVLGDIDHERRSMSRDDYLATCRRRADEIHAALEWAFSATGDSAIGAALTVAAAHLWFELSLMPVALHRVEQALPHTPAESNEEMRLHVALGYALWYTGPKNDAIEPAFAHALYLAERNGAPAERIQALWGMWAARRGRGDYPGALEVARRYADAAESARDTGAIHLSDRILGLTHHILGHQSIAREFAERALREASHLDPISGIGYQVETPVAIGALLARILWLLGFPDQATKAAAEAVAAAPKSGHSFGMAYAVVLAGFPVTLWTGVGDVSHQLDLLATNAAGNQLVEQWRRSCARVVELRGGSESDALIAMFIEAREDPAGGLPFADLASGPNISVPLPGPEPADVMWNTPELLRVDAELLLWHDAPGASSAAEVKLSRALEIARRQSALSWELRVATSLARLWRRLGRVAEARDLLTGTYRKFGEGFGTDDLIRARGMLMDLEADGPSA